MRRTRQAYRRCVGDCNVLVPICRFGAAGYALLCPFIRPDHSLTQLVLRFDVDTPRCVRAGMRTLNRLAGEYGVPFVFFVNFGRAVDLGARRDRRTAPESGEVTKLGTLQKQTVFDVVELLVRNPRLVDVGAEQIRTAAAHGSEIGVHGGSNHGTWQWGYPGWDEHRLAAEVEWSTTVCKDLLGQAPVGFSSPGWVSDERLVPVLARHGFRYLADRHGTGEHVAGESLTNFATALTGEPGGVGFFESCMARNLSTAQVLAEIDAAVAANPHPVVLYDHPCFAGLKGVPLLTAVLEHVRARGWKLTTLAEGV
jgi:hypothetical protein